MSVKVKTCPIMEAIARKLSGIEQCPLPERGRMIARAVKAGKDTAEQLYGGFEMMEKDRENEKLEFENAKLINLLKQIRARLNKGFMRLDESQINDIVRTIDKLLDDNENDTN